MQETKQATETTRVPHDPAVQAIVESHGELEPGALVTYALIEAASLEPRRSNRGRAIIAKWKRHLLAQNIVVRNVPNEGYQVCDSGGRVLECHAKEKAAARRMRYAVRVASGTDRAALNASQGAYLDHVLRIGATIAMYAGVKPKEITPPSE